VPTRIFAQRLAWCVAIPDGSLSLPALRELQDVQLQGLAGVALLQLHAAALAAAVACCRLLAPAGAWGKVGKWRATLHIFQHWVWLPQARQAAQEQEPHSDTGSQMRSHPAICDCFSPSDTGVCLQLDCQEPERQGGAHRAAARAANDRTDQQGAAWGSFSSAAVPMAA
jgi:hypothetical protein